MDVSEIVSAFRQRADDLVIANDDEFEFAPADVFAWLSEAEREACLRAGLIYDDETAKICTIQLVDGVDRYKLDPRIVEVQDVWIDRSAQFPGYHRARLRNTDQTNIGYRRFPGPLSGDGRPCRNGDYGQEFFQDPRNILHVRAYSVDGQKLRVYGKPDTTYAANPNFSYLNLEVYRLPLEPITGENDDLEIPAIHHDGLVDWLLFRAFGGKDGEELDDQRSNRAYQIFEARFGERPSASQVRQAAEGRADCTLGYGGY
ncbi:MAG TPA: hypothetical protein VLE97_01900 [Gaiellaceae bacterium]|nr:hypothetical protein [Gaiellaceae bacterium]